MCVCERPVNSCLKQHNTPAWLGKYGSKMEKKSRECSKILGDNITSPCHGFFSLCWSRLDIVLCCSKLVLFPLLPCRDEGESITKGEISTVCGQTVLRMSLFQFHLCLLSKVLLCNFFAEIPLNTQPTFLTLLFRLF